MKPTTCAECGGAIVQVRKSGRPRLFCSQRCQEAHIAKHGSATAVYVLCRECGKGLWVRRSHFRKSRHGICCSISCGQKLRARAEGEKHGLAPYKFQKRLKTKRAEYPVMYLRDGKRVRMHRAIMEHILGRPLRRGEVVHHRDGNPRNFHPDNLELYDSHSVHLLDHYRENPNPGDRKANSK